MSKFEAVTGYYGQQKGYTGPLLGVCINCNGAPKARIHNFSGNIKVVCTVCGMSTLEYSNIGLAAEAWNSKVKRHIDD